MTAVERRGFWLLVEDAEYYVPFADYPTFAEASVEQIFDARHTAHGQIRWPALDVDIELEALEHPERFPLLCKTKGKRGEPAAKPQTSCAARTRR